MSESLTPQGSNLAGKFARLVKARQRAEEMLLVAIYEAHQDGASYDVIAHMIGDKSPAGIARKIAKGKALAEKR